MGLEENIRRVREQIDAAAREVGRDPGEITLVAATKTQSDRTIRSAIAAGITVCGENRVQEMRAHLEANAYDGAGLHFIGHLQRNKVRQVVGRVDLIQSVDSLRLLEAIEAEAARLDLRQDILVEVNIGREAAKSGFLPEEVFAAAEAALEHPHVRVLGLMTIPPADADRDANMRYFEQVRTLYVDINAKLFHNELKHLSMGMSGDYADAIAAGATMVRVGTAIFGARHYL